jgi:hypothetical protein
MRLGDGIRDPAVEVARTVRVVALGEVEEELTISLRSGQP